MTEKALVETLYTHPRMTEVMSAHRLHLIDADGHVWAGETDPGATLQHLFVAMLENKFRVALIFPAKQESSGGSRC